MSRVRIPSLAPIFMQNVLVYAIRFEDDTIYVGLTKDLLRRLEEHEQRKSRSTKRFKGNFEMIYRKPFVNYIEARKHEKYLKSGYGRRFLKDLMSEGSPRVTR